MKYIVTKGEDFECSPSTIIVNAEDDKELVNKILNKFDLHQNILGELEDGYGFVITAADSVEEI